MADYYFISLVGPDRPGLIEELSDIVLEHKGNWMGSRMAHMSSLFAGVARIQIEADNAAKLEKALNGVLFDNGHIHLYADTNGESESTSSDKKQYHIEIVANDRPGILQEVTHAISSNGINIEELESHIEDGAMASGPLFRCELIISCDNDEQADKAHEDLEALTGEIFIDWRLKANTRSE